MRPSTLAVATAALAGSALVTPGIALVVPASSGGCKGTTYQYFMNVQQWAITECQDVFSCKASNQFFTLHGLWPNDNNGDYPCTCTNEKFDESKIKDLLPAMNTYWPSLNGPSSTFWAHEYEKHGTCAEDVFPTQHDFFNGTLAARTKYDPVAALAKAGIKPSNTKGFTLDAFRSAQSAAYGAYPSVQCDSQGRIEVVNFCLDKQMNAITCPSATPDQCSSSTIYLPASMAASQEEEEEPAAVATLRGAFPPAAQ
jgi:ribonuclease T2